MSMKERLGSFRRVSKYLTEDNYFETLSEDRRVDILWLTNGTEPPLVHGEHVYTSNNAKYVG